MKVTFSAGAARCTAHRDAEGRRPSTPSCESSGPTQPESQAQLPLAPVHSPAAPGRPLPPACEPCSRALSAGAAAGNSSVLMTMAGAGVRLACVRRTPRH